MATKKMIVFDGTFHEEDVEWSDYDGNYLDEIQKNGFSRHASSHGDPECGESVEIHDGGNRHLAIIVLSSVCHYVILPNASALLSFMSLPIIANISSSHTRELIEQVTATLDRLFFLYHGHEGPHDIGDSELGRSCNQCDPGGRDHRESQAKRLRELREKSRSEGNGNA